MHKVCAFLHFTVLLSNFAHIIQNYFIDMSMKQPWRIKVNVSYDLIRAGIPYVNVDIA